MYVKYHNYETNEMSTRVYNILIGLILLWGIGINFLMCKFCEDIFLEWNCIVVIVIYFIAALFGMNMSISSDNPLISFIGYNIVVLPVGMVLSIAVQDYDTVSIMNAFLITSLVMIFMIVLATAIPNVFLSMGKVLFFSLLSVIIFEIIFTLLGIITPTIWDILVALIFCGYIGYDWSKAQEGPHTLDNAVDSVVALYLDAVNLFIAILDCDD